MGVFAKGDVVVAPLDFSDFSDYKRRPALVVATPGGLDPVLCMITSRARNDGFDVPITASDFQAGGLRIDSVVRPCHMFTIEAGVIEYRAGTLKQEKVNEVVDKIVAMLRSQP
jgi:mRNA interferase MazF